MGGHHPEPPDCIEEKDVSGLSTVLVATIQEVKDRISQIEYIFCRQLFPDFLSKSRSLEVACKEQERDLLVQLVDKLKLERQKAVLEGQILRKELFQLAKEKEELNGKLSILQLQVNNIQCDLKQKIEEIIEGIHHQDELIQLVKSGAASSKELGTQLAIHEKEKPLLARHKHLEAAVMGLLEDLRKKDAELARWNQLLVKPVKKDSLGPKGPYKEKPLIDSQKRNELIPVRSSPSRVDVCPEGKDILETTEKANETRISEKRSLGCFVETCVNFEIPKTILQLKEEERHLPPFGVQCSGKDLKEDQQKYYQELMLISERKRIDAVNAYKQLKSQYNFLCKKVGLSSGDPFVPKKFVLENSFSGHQQKDLTTTAQRGKALSTTEVPRGMKKEKIFSEDYIALEDGKEYAAIDNLSSLLHGSSKLVNSKFQDNIKDVTNDGVDTEVEDTSTSSPDFGQEPLLGHLINGELNKATGGKKTRMNWRGTPSGSVNGGELNITMGKKRNASIWRETRSNQDVRGLDPHDDFLDTPFENIKDHLKKAGKYGGASSTVHESRERVIGSDDDSEDLVANLSHKKQLRPVSSAGDECFKFIAPVRKKDEREHLKGIECRQCKKFFDALSDRESKDGRILHCEHHDGVSRHRYGHVPPLTPEGFWNIGFESET
ncbi:hypothetical protein MLD38_027881 [Melastoma candidum]|uniref:Uncharacterized protein n=1 Tax=Melastoma candidum TaxID=119954 RepID=A0ACB9MZI2_9MYRT|nr:hypothetical protein MLD38_027881 [Melastoma candidum]